MCAVSREQLQLLRTAARKLTPAINRRAAYTGRAITYFTTGASPVANAIAVLSSARKAGCDCTILTGDYGLGVANPDS
jgi:hypothetical protein